jgi:hypothetical protein
MLDQATLELFQQQFEQEENRRGGDDQLAALQSPLEVLAYAIELARAGDFGLDECDAVELMLTLLNTDRQTLRGHASTLKALGYQAVATRLRQMARQRSRPARPPGYCWPRYVRDERGVLVRTPGKVRPRLSPRHRNAMN